MARSYVLYCSDILGVFCYFYCVNKKKRATRTISPSMVDKPDVENLMQRHEARLRSLLTWIHIAASQYINGFMSALPGIALFDEQFTKFFLPDFSASQAAYHNPYPICNFVDRGVLLLTIYHSAVIVGLLLYAKLSGKLSLGHMVVITPLALCVGVIISFPAGNMSVDFLWDLRWALSFMFKFY